MRTGVERLLLAIGATMVLAACGQKDQPAATASSAPPAAAPVEAPAPAPESPDNAMTQYASERLGIYTPVRLSADLSHLSAGQREMIGLLIAASDIMDDLFWQQAYGDRDELLDAIDHADTREFARINYGPWDRLDGNAPFVEGVGQKPAGATFYPTDMTTEEFDQAAEGNPALKSLYTMVRRDEAGGLVRFGKVDGEEVGPGEDVVQFEDLGLHSFTIEPSPAPRNRRLHP